jgi:BirA family biotin operon repressor/biotin-[acetyl-CoA-carboxylase] ligase
MLALAANGSVHEGDWMVAERQTAGRGRQGRVWQSPPGNLYASGLVQLRASDPSASSLALVTGLAVIDALGISSLSLKWPNDVLAGVAKLAGILLERQGDRVVIGVGINLAHHPDLADRPAISLAALGVTMSADTAVAALAVTVTRWLKIWRTAGLAAVHTAWLDRAHPIGSPLAASMPDGTRLDGMFDGLSPDGALQLRLADGTTRVIHAGDVFLT